MNYRIFLVEDDRSIADGLRHQLEQWNFAVQVVQNFRGVLGEFTAFDPHLVLNPEERNLRLPADS